MAGWMLRRLKSVLIGPAAPSPQLEGATGAERHACNATLLMAAVAPLLLIGLGNHGFWIPDEPLVAEVSREMFVSGDWVVPHFNGSPFLEMPPLHYAAVALSYGLFGVTPFAARLPSTIAALLTVLATYFLGARLFDARTGRWGALLLPTTYLFVHAAEYCIVDGTLSLFVVLGFLCASFAFGVDRRPWAIPALYAAAALAFLAKGPVGPVLLAPGIAAIAISAPGGWRFFLRPAHLTGIAIFAILVGPWLMALAAAGGIAFLREALVANSVGRFLQIPGFMPQAVLLGEHEFSWYDYFKSLPSSFLPWTPMLLLLVASGLATMRRTLTTPRLSAVVPAAGFDGAERFLWLPLLVGFALLSASSSKRSIYLLPLYPLITLLVARLALRLCERGRAPGLPERLLVGLQCIVAMIGAFAVAAGSYVLSGPYFGWPAGEGAAVRAAALGLVALASSAVVWRAYRRGDYLILFQSLWAQIAGSFLVLIVIVAPLLEVQYGFDAFFNNAVTIEHERHRTPLLFVHKENWTGLAGLHFGVLPNLELPEAHGAAAVESADVLTDDIAGLERLRSVPGGHVTILAERLPTPHADSSLALFLVSVAGLEPGAAP